MGSGGIRLAYLIIHIVYLFLLHYDNFEKLAL